MKIKTLGMMIILCVLLLTMGQGRQGRRWVTRSGGTIRYSRGNVEITGGSLTASQGYTSDTGDIVASAGDIQTVTGDLIASSGNVVLPSGNIVASDQIWSLKTVTKTISIVPAGSVDDFSFAANGDAAEQPVNLGALVPAFAELVSAQIHCFEAVIGGTMSIDLGVTTGAGDILAAGATDALNEINTTVAADSPEVEATTAAKNIWINATPSANWSTLTAGRYSVMVSYIDYGAAHTWSIP